MNNKAQMAGVFTAILIVIAFGLILWAMQPSIETYRLNAINDQSGYVAASPLNRIIIYGLDQLLWGFWALLGALFIGLTAVKGGG